MMTEKTFFNYDGVRVTNTRFIVDGQTFVMSNITSVTPMEQKPNRIIPALLMLIGIVLGISGVYSALVLSVMGVIKSGTQA